MSSKFGGPHRKRLDYAGVVLTTPVSVPYERYSPHSAQYWMGQALRGLVRGAAIEKRDIDGLSVASFTLPPDSPVGLTQHYGLSTRWLDHVPFGGASGIVSLRRAARAVQAGDAEIVACVSGDAHQRGSFHRLVQGFSRFSQDAVYPYGAAGPNGSFALLTDHYMRRFDVSREDFGRICIAQRQHAMAYPHALLQQPMTMDDYLAARMICDPVCLFDCVMPCAGAEGFLVMHEETARALKLPYAHLRSAVERHNAMPEAPIQDSGGWVLDRAELWSVAGLTPDRIDVLQTYDDYPVIVMMQIEDLGFCAKGEVRDFLRSHDLRPGGSFPHNTSGGQLSVGQAGAVGGYLGLVEALRQVTRQSLGIQVSDARYALVSGYGMINYDRGLCSGAAILEGAAR